MGTVSPMSSSAPATTRAVPPWVVLVLVCFAQFMVILDGTIVNVALPSIQEDLGFSPGDLAWVINSYTLLFGGFLLLGGRAADLFGRRRLFVAGVAVFTVASLLNALATSPGQLIAFRGLQGLGAALVSPAALSIITTTFAEGPERNRALGVWAAIAGGGSAVGLILGGVLVETLSWPWVFIVNVPVGVLVVLAALRWVPESRAEDARGGFDLAGAASVTGGLVALVYAVVEASDRGWGSSSTLGFGALAIVLLAAFVVIERRHAAPLVRLGILRVRSLLAANVVVLLAVAGMFAMFFFATIYTQEVLGYSPLESGLAFLPFTAGIIGGSVLAQVVIRRLGLRTAIIAGLVLAAGGLFLMTRLSVGGDYLTELLPAVVLLAAGMGLVFVPVTVLGTSGLDAADQGLASGLFNTSQQFGGALGLAVLATLATSRTDSRLGEAGASPSELARLDALVSGYHVAFLAGGVLMLLAAVVTAVLVRGRDVEGLDPEGVVLGAA
jgi:EmrB/QacA subfamily drug resistance transporter